MSFDAAAAIASAIEDALTTLHTRPVLDAVLPKECCRAERFEHWLSMMLIDVDNLSGINKAHGYGVGDRILERMGILLRAYFRQHDWVARLWPALCGLFSLFVTWHLALLLARQSGADAPAARRATTAACAAS